MMTANRRQVVHEPRASEMFAGIAQFLGRSMRAECSGDELSKLDSEGLAKRVDLATDLPSLDLQRDDNGDNCRKHTLPSLPAKSSIISLLRAPAAHPTAAECPL